MSAYVIFSYQFKTVDDCQLSLQFPGTTEINPKESFLHKQEILEAILKSDNFSFNSGPNDDTFVHDVIRHQDSITLLQVGKKHIKKRHNRKMMQEEFEDFPNSFIFVDNRTNVQRIAIGKKEDALGKTVTVAKLLQDRLNHYLAPYRLTVEINAKYYSKTFWNHVSDFKPGFTKVTFTFNIPNNPELTKLVEKFIPMEAEAFNGVPVHTMLAKENDRLTIEHGDFVDRIVNYCSGSGLPITLQPVGSSRLIKCYVEEDNEEKNAVIEDFDDKITKALVKEKTSPTIDDANWGKVIEFLNHIKLFYADDSKDKQ